MSARSIHIQKYGYEPIHQRTHEFDIKKDKLADFLDFFISQKENGFSLHSREDNRFTRTFHGRKATKKVIQENKNYFLVREGEFFWFTCGHYTNIRVMSNSLEKSELELKILSMLEDLCDENVSKIGIICKSPSGFYTEDFKIESNGFDFSNYNSGFEEVHNYIQDRLEKTNTGLILLHGVPGTGKTFYIRYLISICEKKMIYMPPDMSDSISSPDFVSFLMENPDTILLIEDAENILMDRQAGGSQAVANILNLSAGILGDALKIQIICTFNTEINHIDKALLRPGRLIAKHEFKELDEGKTLELFQNMYNKVPPKKIMTLAEIYNSDEPKFDKPEEKHAFGFI